MQPPETSPLYKVREAQGITRTRLAAIVGTHRSTILRLERGEIQSPELAEKLVKVLGEANINEIHILYPDRFRARGRLGKSKAEL